MAEVICDKCGRKDDMSYCQSCYVDLEETISSLEKDLEQANDHIVDLEKEIEQKDDTIAELLNQLDNNE